MCASEASEQPLHPDLEPLAFLLGTWRGEGNGEFHSVEPFTYEEEIRFSHRGGPWLIYEQRAWSPEDESLLHIEMGFWRMIDDEGGINTFVSLPAGTDFSEGSLEGTSISLEASASPMAEGVEQVTSLRRNYRLDGNALTYEIYMGTNSKPAERHVAARLRRA